MGCWKRKFLSAEDILGYGKNAFGLKETKEAYETGEKLPIQIASGDLSPLRQ
jgi:hypothetical protein